MRPICSGTQQPQPQQQQQSSSQLPLRRGGSLQDGGERQMMVSQQRAPSSTGSSRRMRLADEATTTMTSTSQQDTSLGAPSPSFATSSESTATEPRYHSFPSQACCTDCATWSSHVEEVAEKTELADQDITTTEDDDEEVDLDEDETSIESSSASGLRNDDSGGWVKAAPSRPVSASMRSHYHETPRHHRIVEPTTSSPTVSYRDRPASPPPASKEKSSTKSKPKSISSSLRSKFSRRNSDQIRSIANGLKMAQNQAIAVAGLLAEVDASQCKVCDTCFSHRASYHGRGELEKLVC